MANRVNGKQASKQQQRLLHKKEVFIYHFSANKTQKIVKEPKLFERDVQSLVRCNQLNVSEIKIIKYLYNKN